MIPWMPQQKESLLITCEPYKTFTEKIRATPHAQRDGLRIEIPIPEEQSFFSSFLDQYQLGGTPKIILKFHQVSQPGEKERFAVELVCQSWVDEDLPLSYYNEVANRIESQAYLFYIPGVAMDVDVRISSTFDIVFHALLPQEANLVRSGHLLLNQLVTMMTFQN